MSKSEIPEFKLEPLEFELESLEFKLEPLEFELDVLDFELEPLELKLNMTTLPAPICLSCKNLHKNQPEFGLTCKAFPKGIPQKIVDSEADHRKPFRGDNGIRFESVDKEAKEYAEIIFDDN